MRSTFQIKFFLKKGAAKVNGRVPIVGRITVDGEFHSFATKLDADPDLWDQKLQRLKTTRGDVGYVKSTNAHLDFIFTKLHEIYRNLLMTDPYVTALKIKNQFLGITARDRSLMALFKSHLENLEKMAGTSIKEATLQKYKVTYTRLRQYLVAEHTREDIPLLEINYSFISGWEVYLRTQCQCSVNTTAKFIQRFRTVFLIAKNNGWITADPFANYKIKLKKIKRDPLSNKEIASIALKKIDCERLDKVRDCLIFSIFTGLAYIDSNLLREPDIKTGFDGQQWIMTQREKTETDIAVPLLDIPLAIIAKYKGKLPGGRILPSISNQKMNAYLKEIADICGIKKKLTFHLARHTFATTITLANGVPIETVSKMLGHTNIKTTQIYAQVLNEKISSDMNSMASRYNLNHQLQQPAIEIRDVSKIYSNILKMYIRNAS